jgi:colanic acid biosynthesis glycosyl transferase WcaI
MHDERSAAGAPPLNRKGRPIRVVFVTITFDPEPGALRGLPLAKWLMDRGYEVEVLTAFPQYPAGKLYKGYRMRPWMRETMDGVPILRVPIYPSHDTNPLKRIWTYLSFMLAASTIGVSLVGRADVVYLYEPPPTNGLASLILKWTRGAPIVHHIADMWPETVVGSGMLPGGSLVSRLAAGLIGIGCRFLYRQAAVMSVLSPGFKRLLIERGVPEDKIEIIYNWTDEATFRPLERDPLLAAELGMTGRFNFVYAGNIGPLQGLETVVRAACTLQPEAPEIQIVIIGTGPHSARVQALAQEIGASNVRFIPRREYWEMPQINALSDVLLVHLRDYPFLAATVPSKTQVALASGRPVLMAVRGDAADIVRSAGAGVVVPPDDPNAMAEAMLRLYRLPEADRTAMGSRGVEFYRREMSLEIAGAQHDRIFRRLGGVGATAATSGDLNDADSAGLERSIQRAGP